ncbi:MAG: hypothetical protein EBV46_04635, partial [Burkholderiaceae bacterium]|nr:hypothetical protein [Burkholderiaceae bacterium]
TPIINTPSEIGVLFNILRGYIKTWTFPIHVNTTQKVTTETIRAMMERENFKTMDFMEYSQNRLTVTRNPYGFINNKTGTCEPSKKTTTTTRKLPREVTVGGKTRKKRVKLVEKHGTEAPENPEGFVDETKNIDDPVPDGALYVVPTDCTNTKSDKYEPPFLGGAIGDDSADPQYRGMCLDETGNMNDRVFVTKIRDILTKNGLEVTVVPRVELHKCLPDQTDAFVQLFVDTDTGAIKNSDMFVRRILGLTSYFKSAQEGLLPSFVKTDEGEVYHIVRTDMSDYQFEEYASIRKEEYEKEKTQQKMKKKRGTPAPGGDVMRNPEVLPSGRNLHGFDPFRIPSAFAVKDGAKQAQKILQRHIDDAKALPESIALVLWGSDNLKSEGGQIGQALALLGALPRFDGYGRLAGATLIPLAELGRPRIDVVITLSGIFRDLMPLQIKLLAEAAYLAAAADEPIEQNFVRKHALAYMNEHGCDLETAALRVYGNADGTYGANVNHLVEHSVWDEDDELAETYMRRKGFAYGKSGKPVCNNALLKSVLADVSMSYQNLESMELGVTTIDNYFDTLGGITKAVKRAKGGEEIPVYIGDQTQGEGVVRTLSEQVSLETRTRMLNPKWFEGMLKHGYEGVRQIEVHITNTMGWSATTGQVQPWVYKQLTQTFILDPKMRERLAQLNPTASARMANRLMEASNRNYWQPDDEMRAAMKQASEELEDRLEGVFENPAMQRAG